MGNLRKLDILAISASGGAAKLLSQFLQNLKEDVIDALMSGTVIHRAAGGKVVVADSSDLPTSIALGNDLKAFVIAHLASEGTQGVHVAASAEAIAAADATDLATGLTLANELKADYNTHRSEAGVHIANDAGNIVAAADATDQASLDTLLNEIKTDLNAHMLLAMNSSIVE